MSEDSGSGDDPKLLRKENLRLVRRLRQVERLARNSEQIAKQSKAANQRTVTDLKNRSAELEAATRQAESAVLTKDLFLATMSHEIRTPMNGVIGCIELIDQSRLDEDQLQVVQTLRNSANSLMALLNDVLDFAKLESGRTTLESLPFGLDQLLQEVAQLHKASATLGGGVRIVVEIEPDLGPSFIGDPYRLRQVVNNLTSNAVKFTSAGQVTLRAERSGTPAGVRLSVSDTGIGMTADVLESIFQPFRQADESTTRKFGGTGLGLAICKSLVEAMGGSLQVTSEPGAGSCFSFEIELYAAEDGPEPEARRSDVEAGESNELAGLRVLVVDDNPVNLLVATKMLKRLGCQATKATGGLEAIQRASEQTWDVILMDCSMPEIDGYEATRRIRASEKEGQEVTIAALTAFAMPGDSERSLAAGMNHHLTKPLRLETLQAMLEKCAAAPRKAA